MSCVRQCRPQKNRAPLPDEAHTCMRELLVKQLKIIRPSVICCLGSVATHMLLDSTDPISHMRGKQLQRSDYIVVPTYHPAYILRNNKGLPFIVEDLKQAAVLSGLISH